MTLFGWPALDSFLASFFSYILGFSHVWEVGGAGEKQREARKEAEIGVLLYITLVTSTLL